MVTWRSPRFVHGPTHKRYLSARNVCRKSCFRFSEIAAGCDEGWFSHEFAAVGIRSPFEVTGMAELEGLSPSAAFSLCVQQPFIDMGLNEEHAPQHRTCGRGEGFEQI